MISHEFSFIMVNIPFSGGAGLEEDYVKYNHEFVIASNDTRKLAQSKPLIGTQLAKTIYQFYDYELFAIVKSPYLRAFEMWKSAQHKLKNSGIGKLTLGNYYENLLNNWKCAPDDAIVKQSDYIKSTNGVYLDFEVDVSIKNLFKYEFLVDGNISELNEYFQEIEAPTISFYSDGVKYDDSWNDHFDAHAIEVVNYIFEDDFQLCGYRKL